MATPNEKPRVARGDNLATQPLVRLVHGQRNAGPASLEYANDAGVQMLGVAAPLELLGWTVMVEQPRSEAYAVADVLTRQLIFIIGLALLVTRQRRLFLRPLVHPADLRADARHPCRRRRAGSTNASRSPRATNSSELGDAFNSMADKLVELTEDVRKKERQAMFGRMAAGLVHDLSHPVQNIGNSCKLIVRVFDDPEYRQTFTRTIDREIDTLKRVLDDLRNVARPAPVERFPLDVNRSVADIVESMRGFAEESGIALEPKFASEPVIIEGDVFALGRVYRNLITNAIQATQAGGRVTIATPRDRDHVEVSVTDTGSGIPTERLGAIFDDFVTTKKRGLGLGLAITKRIVEQLGGTISVASEVGKGTTFTMRFPSPSVPSRLRRPAG